MLHYFLAAGFAFSIPPCAALDRAADEMPNVRILHADVLATFAQSRQSSPRLAALVDTLEQSDVIVHVVEGSSTHHAIASMHWVTASGGFRFLRISIHANLSPRLRASLLAHELQHAVEVVCSPAVMDAQGFAALYRHIGRPSIQEGCSHCYDTLAAQRAGRAVWRELQRVQFTY